jgi:HD-like signal output (HDOD) protein
VRTKTPSGANAAKRQILFVDDEQGVLDGLRNVLRGQRREWEMVFAPGGTAALAEIDRRPFDVVVSDMRMPGIDGATLLTRVKEKQPRAVRIVLSGQTDLESAMRTVLVAHQFLSKPCDAETLRSTVERACKLNTMLQSENLRKMAGDVSMLPSSPGVYSAITQALANNRSSISDVARIVEKDPGLCAKILQVANSAFFGIGRKVTSVTEASTYLGLVTLKNLALMLESFPQLQGAGGPQKETFRKLQIHSLLVGFLARQIVGTKDKRRSDEAFVAGMLHDIGHVIFAMRGDAVAAVGGVDHASLGAYLLGIWGLPHPVTEVVANHDQPGAVEHAGFEVVDAVYLADRIAGRIREAPFDPDTEFDVERMQRLGVTADQMAAWEATGREQIDALSAF